VRLETLESGRSDIRQTLDRAEKFLNLVALAGRHAQRGRRGAGRTRLRQPDHLDDCAMLRVLGLGQRTIALGYIARVRPVVGLGASLHWAWRSAFGVHYMSSSSLLAGLVSVSALPAPTPLAGRCSAWAWG
jgi:putative ABC transport system permease protein